MNLDISVIVCAYTFERWDLMTVALDSAARQVPPPAELILVVDWNPDLLQKAKYELHGVRVLANAGRRGLSAARNTGLEAARGEIVAFLDDDAEADAGWLAALVAPYGDERVVATGGKAVPVWETGRPRWMPEEFDWVVGCSYRGLPDIESEVRNPIGCSMSMRRLVAIDVGGFRTDVGRIGTVPTGAEETELAIRLRRIHPRCRIMYVPASIVRHHAPASRARWSYFRSRCYHEGRSKAILSKLEGTRSGLSSERAYLGRVLPTGVFRGLRQLVHGDRGGAMRATAIIAGASITIFGYVTGRMGIAQR